MNKDTSQHSLNQHSQLSRWVWSAYQDLQRMVPLLSNLHLIEQITSQVEGIVYFFACNFSFLEYLTLIKPGMGGLSSDKG